MRLYACQIYNSTAVEFDFVPCKTSAGVVGLWDNVSNKFYSNAGVGSFKAGPSSVDLTAHKTMINGTIYTVQGGKCMVGGTVYNIIKGRTLINGTAYDITLPSIVDLISFTIDVSNYGMGVREYHAERGMTWGEWVNSDYNVDGFSIPYGEIVGPNGGTVVDATTSSWYVKSSDEIVDGRDYTTSG